MEKENNMRRKELEETQLIQKNRPDTYAQEEQINASADKNNRLKSVAVVCSAILMIAICIICFFVLRRQLRLNQSIVQNTKKELKRNLPSEFTTEQAQKTFEQSIIDNHIFIEGALLTMSSRDSSWIDHNDDSTLALACMMYQACVDINTYMLNGDSAEEDISSVRLGSNGNIGQIFPKNAVLSYSTGYDDEEFVIKVEAFKQWIDFLGYPLDMDSSLDNLSSEFSQIEGCYMEDNKMHVSADMVIEPNDKYLSNIQYMKTKDGNIQVKYDVYVDNKIHSSDTATLIPSDNKLGFELQSRTMDLFQPKLAVMKSLLPMFKVFRPDILTGDAALSELSDEDIAEMVTYAFLENYLYIQEPYQKNVYNPDQFFNGYVPILTDDDDDYIGMDDENYIFEDYYGNIIVSQKILRSCLVALGADEESVGYIDEMELDNYVLYYGEDGFVICLNLETDIFYKLCPEDVSPENYDDYYEMGKNGEICLSFGISHALEDENDGIRYRAVFTPADNTFGYVLTDIGIDK